MKTEVWAPGPPACNTFRPGAVLRISGTVRYCWVCISFSVTMVMELANCLAGVTTPVGLTTVEPIVPGI